MPVRTRVARPASPANQSVRPSAGARMAGRRTQSGTGSVVGVVLLFDELRAQQLVDLALGGGAAVVRAVDRTCEFDEALAEVAVPLAVADVVLDLPEQLVDPAEFRCELVEFRRRVERLLAGRTQAPQLAVDVRELVRVADPLGLDLEDRDLVDQLAWRHLDLQHRPHNGADLTAVREPRAVAQARSCRTSSLPVSITRLATCRQS